MNDRKSFWKTLPGILTALAALIGALASIITALHSTGLFDRKPQELAHKAPNSVFIPGIANMKVILAGKFHKDQWHEMGYGDISFIHGNLGIRTQKGDDVLVWAKQIDNLEDILYAISSRIISVEGPVVFGPLFWFRDPDNYYHFAIQFGGRFRLIRVKDGVPETLIPWTLSPKIKGVYKKQEFKVVTIGRSISLFVDNSELITYDVGKKSAGGVGIYAEQGISIEFMDMNLMASQ